MLNPWFVTGFCEGESAFTYSRSGKNINLYFAIKFNKEDSYLIQCIFDFFSVGKIYEVKPRLPGNRSGNMKETAYYRVTRVRDLGEIARHFEHYPLQGKKAKAYKVWKEMLDLKTRFRRVDIDKLNYLARELSALSIKNTATATHYNA